MRSHGALRKLAVMFAREGFHVLRFDYYATGDSAGHASEGTLSEWRRNIDAARDDLSDCSGTDRVSVVGIGLGAALATSVVADVTNLVLWEPVVNGSSYVNDLRRLHKRQFARQLFPPPLPVPGAGGTLLGLPFPKALEAEIHAIDLVGQEPPRAQHVALVVSERRPDYMSLAARLESSSREMSVELCHIPAEPQRGQPDAMLLVSAAVLQAMASVLTRRAA